MSQTSYFVHTLHPARDWQDRPEFEQLCNWWRKGGHGVCALVAIGGAGKTAIADRFLRVLPGGYPPHPKVPKDETLTPPERTFIFSFYAAPNPDSFLANLARWCGVDPSEDLAFFKQILEKLPSSDPRFIVLDGLEKVQEDSSRGGKLGQINDSRLRDLVLKVADGFIPNVSLLITSRYRLYDTLAKRSDLYTQINVGKLEPATAIKLLQDRGSYNKGGRLPNIAKEHGFHALSIDLIGGFIARFCKGDPTQMPSLEKIDLSDLDPNIEPRDQELIDQERRFARLASFYHEALIKSDPAALDLLQRVCLFRRGVDAKLLADVFTGESKETVSGPLIAHLTEQQIEKKLLWLSELRLLEEDENGKRSENAPKMADSLSFHRGHLPTYSVHPAVRAGFLSSVDSAIESVWHDAAHKGLLSGLPDDYMIDDPDALDVLEETVYHAISSGHIEEAWEDIYQRQIGGSENLLYQLGAYDRGERICRLFAWGASPEEFTVKSLQGTARAETSSSPAIKLPSEILTEWANYLTYLGRLNAASGLYQVDIARKRHKDWWRVYYSSRKLCDVWILAGRLKEAMNWSREALDWAVEGNYVVEQIEWVGRHGHASALRGACADALEDVRIFQELRKADPLAARRVYWQNAIYNAILLSRLGLQDDAIGVLDGIHPVMGMLVTEDLHHRIEVAHASLLCDEQGSKFDLGYNLDETRDNLIDVREWAMERDAKEVLCWSDLVLARIELAAINDQPSSSEDEAAKHMTAAKAAIGRGLRIARDCGFSLYHIDLLIEQANLHLLLGDPAAALKDIELALDTGIPLNDTTGQPELLAANHEKCGYAWAIAAGLQLRAEASLLRAAQMHGEDSYVPAKIGEMPSDISQLIDQAKQHLLEALDRWYDLRNPEAVEDNNIHLNGKPYNYRAAETHGALSSLKKGLLTNYPLSVGGDAMDERLAKNMSIRDEVFISYSHEDQRWREELQKMLTTFVDAGLMKVWDDTQIPPGAVWRDEIEQALGRAKIAVLLVTANFLASRFIKENELPPLLKAAQNDGVTIFWIPFSSCIYENTEIEKYQAAYNPSEPLYLKSPEERYAALKEICTKLNKIVNP